MQCNKLQCTFINTVQFVKFTNYFSKFVTKVVLYYKDKRSS